MQLKTILNRVEKQKGFVYSEARMSKAGHIEFTLQPRRGSKPICGACGKKGATYDHSTTRRFEFVPLWAIRECVADLLPYAAIRRQLQ